MIVEARFAGAPVGQLAGVGVILAGVFKFRRPRSYGSAIAPATPTRFELLFIAVIVLLLIVGRALR